MLTNDDIQDLVFFFCEYESTVGVHSLFSAMIERAFLYHTEQTIPHDYNGILPKATQNPGYSMDLLPLCWGRNIHDKNGGKVARGRRVRNTLLEMIDKGETRYVTVLYRLYGSPPPGIDWRLFPEPTLAPLAALTDSWTRHKDSIESLAINDPKRNAVFEEIMEEAASIRQCAEESYLACQALIS